MLMKAFNRGVFRWWQKDFQGKTNLTKKTFTKLSNINIHYEAFSRMNFFRKKEETNFHDLTKVRIVYILKRKKMLQKIYLNNYIVSICSNSRRISTLETRNVGYIEVFKIYIYQKNLQDYWRYQTSISNTSVMLTRLIFIVLSLHAYKDYILPPYYSMKLIAGQRKLGNF